MQGYIHRWHLVTSDGLRYSCNVLFGCTGYYSYENPYEPKFPGQEDFPGPIVHPQKWKPGVQFNRHLGFRMGSRNKFIENFRTCTGWSIC